MKIAESLSQVGGAALLIATAAFLLASDTPPHPANLTVHEWGTFTSVAGEDGSAIDWDVLGGNDDLPKFVNHQSYPCFKIRLTGTVRMETPVIYFYSPTEVTASVNVQFPHGVITEWYPSGDNAIYESKSLMDRMDTSAKSSLYSPNAVYSTKSLIDPPPDGLTGQVVRLSPTLNGLDTSLRHLMGTVGWNDIKIQPASTADFIKESRPSRYYAARATDAAPITAGLEHEKFLFYRGVAQIPVPLSARLAQDGRLVVENLGSEPIPAAILFENRGGHLGYRDAGAIRNAATIDAPTLDGSFTQLRQDLETVLVAQGLYPKEAHAMVETWKDSWFEEGSRLIYIVPAAALNAILPLQVTPAPSQTARVFVGRIELITAETKRTVEDALARKDWPLVQKYARFLNPILQRIASGDRRKVTELAKLRQGLPNFFEGAACR